MVRFLTVITERGLQRAETAAVGTSVPALGKGDCREERKETSSGAVEVGPMVGLLVPPKTDSPARPIMDITAARVVVDKMDPLKVLAAVVVLLRPLVLAARVAPGMALVLVVSVAVLAAVALVVSWGAATGLVATALRARCF